MKNASTLVKTITTIEGTVHVYDTGLLESYINDGARLDVPYLIDGKAALLELGLGKKFYVVTLGIGFYQITKEARILSASKTYSDHLSAVAVVVGRVSTKYILELYMKIDKPVVPTRAFTHLEAAYEWLSSMKSAEGMPENRIDNDDIDSRLSP